MQSQDPNGDLTSAVWESGYPSETGKHVLCWDVCLSELEVPALKQMLRAPVSQIRSVGWHFLVVCIELL